MMTPSHMEERRPRGKGTAFQKPTDPATSNAPKSAPIVVDAADLLEGVHVLLVAYKVAGEVRYRRRVFLNLPAAQRAHDRAIQRGHAASITLCKLAPTRTFGGGWSVA